MVIFDILKRINRYPLYSFASLIFYEIINKNINFNSTDTILEIGVGNGYTAYRLADKVEKVIGVDIAKETMNFLEKFNDKKNLQFIYGDACDRIFMNNFRGKFDKVYSSDVMEHVFNPSNFIQSMSMVLKKNGLVVITFPNSPKHGRNCFFSDREIKNLFQESGLEIMELNIIKFKFILNYISRFYFKCLNIFHKLRSKNKKDVDVDEFDGTWCSKERKKLKFYHKLFNLCFEILMFVSKITPLFSYSTSSKIMDKRLLIIARKIN